MSIQDIRQVTSRLINEYMRDVSTCSMFSHMRDTECLRKIITHNVKLLESYGIFMNWVCLE